MLLKRETQKPPVTIIAKAPFVTLLDTCPSPRAIAIPQKRVILMYKN
jgi:hypothetical protein